MTRLRLKARIVEIYGSQGNFCQKMNLREPFVSEVVRCRRELDYPTRKLWAAALDSDVHKLFSKSEAVAV